MKEVFKQIPDYPDYEVSNLGRVRSNRRKKPIIMKPSRQRRGYLSVELSNDEGKLRHLVHRLVLAVHGPPKPIHPEGWGMVCMHIDNCVHNNVITNLQWGTQSANILQAVAEDRHYHN